MLNCKEASRLLSDRLDRQLSLAERVGLRVHLLMCDGCRNFSSQMAFLREACRRRFSAGRDSDPT